MEIVVLDIAHLSFSSAGGAGTVASRLADLQRAEGHRSWVHSAISGSLWQNPWRSPLHAAAAGIDHYFVKRSNYPSPISLTRDLLHRRLPDEVAHADVIHVHWPNGLVALSTLSELSHRRRVVWTLHDMNPFTGACHYSVGCDCDTSVSGRCAGVGTVFSGWSATHRAEKASFFESSPDLRVVSPSHWLADAAGASAVLGGRPITVIPNPLPPHLPTIERAVAWRGELLLGQGPVFVASASELSDSLKNISTVVDAFEKAFPHDSTARLVLVGNGSVKSTHPGVSALGRGPPEELMKVLATADWFVVASHAENQPLAISEAQSMGVSLLGADRTGLPEHLDIDEDGGLFADANELVELMRSKQQTPRTVAQRKKLMKRARKKFSPASVAARYEEVYLASS